MIQYWTLKFYAKADECDGRERHPRAANGPHSSFSVTQKVGNIVTFVQFLMGINCTQLSIKSVSKQIYICHGALD